ncbi:MAG: RNA-binding protein [Patescibacteria group bacterium]
MSKKLYVGNLLYEVDDNGLRDLFSQFGTVVSAQVIVYRDSGRSKGFGFVEFESEEDAAKAIEALNGQDNQGRRLVVSEARPMEPRQPGDRGPRRDDRSNGGDRGSYGRDQHQSRDDHNRSDNRDQNNDDFGADDMDLG